MSNWFDIGLSILSIHNKTGILVFASIAEAMMVGFIQSSGGSLKCSEDAKFHDMIECLLEESVLPPELAEGLHWLRNQRNNIHLKKVSLEEQSKEYGKYSFDEYNKARNVVQALNNALIEEYCKL